MPDQRQFREDVRLLQELLDQTLSEQCGDELVREMRQLQQLARERRSGLPGAEDRLIERIAGLSEDMLRLVVRALSLEFDLANLCEDLQRVRVLRERDAERGDQPGRETIAAAIAQLAGDGLTAERVRALLARLDVDLVFTAHPTEAKRRATRRILSRLRDAVRARMDAARPRELAANREQLLGLLTLLWQIDPIRPNRPTVMNEVERGLFFVDGLWEVLPRIQQELRGALTRSFPGESFAPARFLRFGSWIGGDRDGNPYVTADVTESTLGRLQAAAVERHLRVCRELSHLLVMSIATAPIDERLLTAMNRLLDRSPGLKSRLGDIADVELYRRWLGIIESRLKATLDTGSKDASLAYRSADELLADVELLRESLVGHGGNRIARLLLDDWTDQIRTFGLQFAALDVRQDSRVHVDVLTELFRKLGVCDDYGIADEATRVELLTTPHPTAVDLAGLAESDAAKECLALFQLLARTVDAGGSDRLGGFVISMSHYPSDVLAVLWFWQWAWRQQAPEKDLAYLPIVPLLETIDDLRRGPAILEQLFAVPAYASYLRSRPGMAPAQMVMVGYSDSTKDGGYLSASWGLFRAQDKLADVTAKAGVRLVVFHGRGGALGRGGGPAARAILSLPPRSVDGSLRMTEQGEVLAERYDDPQIAHRHLEQVTWATLLVSARSADTTPDGWPQLIDQLSERSYRHYRELVEDPGFLKYFDQATPIGDIERLPIGSRPSRRRERKSLSDLRAIPWTFAWTQSRHFLPAWYGLGKAIVEAVQARRDDWSEFETMYRQWPHFRATIDNAALALSKADLAIAQRYAKLVDDEEAGSRVFGKIQEEFDRSKAAVMMIANESTLLASTPWLQQSIHERNPSVDPLNLIQIELTRRLRATNDEQQEERLRALIRLTIQGVASGLRTTG